MSSAPHFGGTDTPVAKGQTTYVDAIREGIREEMVRDERVFLLGEDIGAFGGAFGVTAGLQAEFGESRVIDTPIAENGKLHALQDSFWEKHGLQCGFCTPGMILTAHNILEKNPKPTDAQIRHGLEGNLCRCTGYQNIVAAVREAATRMKA